MSDDEFTDEQLSLLSKALEVDSRLVHSELLCVSLNKKLERGEKELSRSDLLEAWNVIPKFFTHLHASAPTRCPDAVHSHEPRVIYSAANPTSSTCLLNGLTVHPHLTRLVTSFIKR